MTPKKEKALRALLTAPTRAEAARVAGISENTMREYFKDPEFQAAYKAQFSELMEAATRQAQRQTTTALSVLMEVMEDREQGAQARLSAARTALEYSMKLTEQRDVVERVEALEKQLEEDERWTE